MFAVATLPSFGNERSAARRTGLVRAHQVRLAALASADARQL
jgi:hypothetical protein